MDEKQDVNLGCPYGPSRPKPWPGEDASKIQAQLAAKDREIADLRRQRNEASVLQLRAMKERDEARECVRRLCATGDDVGSWLSAALSDDMACAEFKASCERMLAALAATPEHLRG